MKLYSCKFDFKTMQIFCKAKLNLKAIPKIFKSKITQVNVTTYLACVITRQRETIPSDFKTSLTPSSLVRYGLMTKKNVKFEFQISNGAFS